MVATIVVSSCLAVNDIRFRADSLAFPLQYSWQDSEYAPAPFWWHPNINGLSMKDLAYSKRLYGRGYPVSYIRKKVSEPPEMSSKSEEERSQPPKKSDKDDFDSNSYFMLRALRRLPMEEYQPRKLENILSKQRKKLNYYR